MWKSCGRKVTDWKWKEGRGQCGNGRLGRDRGGKIGFQGNDFHGFPRFILSADGWMDNKLSSVQFSSVTQSCPTLCNPMNHSMPGLPVHHQLREFTQTHVELVMPSSHLILCRPLLLLPQSLPASGCFPMSQLFTWGGQSTGVSALASFLPKKSQGWSPPEWTGWISLQSKG